MGTISPTPSRRALLGAFAATPAIVVSSAPLVAEPLDREFAIWDDEPVVVRRSMSGRRHSKSCYQSAELLFDTIEEGPLYRHSDLLCRTGNVIQLALSAHLLDVGFPDDWCEHHIGQRLSKSLHYANASGFNYHHRDAHLLASILTPFDRWRNSLWADEHDDYPFCPAEIIDVTCALLEHVRHVTGHPHPWGRGTRHA